MPAAPSATPASSERNWPVNEIYGGVTYTHLQYTDVAGFGFSYVNNMSKRWGAEVQADFYSGDCFFCGWTATSSAGPRVNFRPVFLHVLAGVQHYGSKNYVSGTLGGGAEWRATNHFGVQTSVDYLLNWGGSVQKNVRASVGPVFTFGEKPSRTAVVTQSTGDLQAIPGLGIQVLTHQGSGLRIAEVAAGSVAELAGLRVGDVVNSVEGKAVRSARELTGELSNRAPGSKIKIGYLTRGYWQTETVLILPR